MTFKLLTYVRHKEQEIEGLVISPSSQNSSHVTIYDPDCPNDDDYEEIFNYRNLYRFLRSRS